MEYQRRWRAVNAEHRLMSIWHCCINLFQCVPLMYTSIRVRRIP